MATQAIAGAVDKVLAAALPGVLKPIGMQVYNGHPMWSKIDQGARKRPWAGESIQAAVMTSTYGKAASYVNDDTVDTTAVEPFTAVQFQMGGYQVSINIPGMKIRQVQNAPTKLFELMKAETRGAMIDMMDLMSTHAFQSTNDAKGILSLYTLTDASTTIAGLSGSSTWGGTTTASGSFALQGKNDMMTLYTTLSQYASFEETGNTSGFQMSPDLCICPMTVWQYYWNSLEAGFRYTPDKAGDIKFAPLTFMGMPFVSDQHVTSGVLFMLRTSELYLYVHPDADFTILPTVRDSTQPDMWSRAVIWNGQLTLNSRRYQGKLTSLVA